MSSALAAAGCGGDSGGPARTKVDAATQFARECVDRWNSADNLEVRERMNLFAQGSQGIGEPYGVLVNAYSGPPVNGAEVGGDASVPSGACLVALENGGLFAWAGDRFIQTTAIQTIQFEEYAGGLPERPNAVAIHELFSAADHTSPEVGKLRFTGPAYAAPPPAAAPEPAATPTAADEPPVEQAPALACAELPMPAPSDRGRLVGAALLAVETIQDAVPRVDQSSIVTATSEDPPYARVTGCSEDGSRSWVVWLKGSGAGGSPYSVEDVEVPARGTATDNRSIPRSLHLEAETPTAGGPDRNCGTVDYASSAVDGAWTVHALGGTGCEEARKLVVQARGGFDASGGTTVKGAGASRWRCQYGEPNDRFEFRCLPEDAPESGRSVEARP